MSEYDTDGARYGRAFSLWGSEKHDGVAAEGLEPLSRDTTPRFPQPTGKRE